MKKIIFLALISFLLIGALSAQGRGFGWASPPTAPEVIRIDGTLQLQNGHIVLSTGSTVYFVPGLMRYIGFIDGLREGERIIAEGYAYNNILQPTKITISGRDYDFAANTPGWGPMSGPAGWGAMCCHSYGPMMGHHFGGRGNRVRGRW